ncbi:MAG: hypothetical protein PHO41_07600 [Eubacteriales bacterium]|nr:hypothetical protein [Eubacteriales bacterium]
MKKVLIVALIVALMMAAAVPAMAVGNVIPTEAAQEFFTWAILATYAGAVLATTLITQLLKGVGFIQKIPARIVSYVIALIVLLTANYFLGGFTLEQAALCVINAAVVALAANGTYDMLNENKQTE